MKVWMLAAAAIMSATQAHARDRAPAGPVMLEVIGTGGVEIRASSQRLAISYSARGKTSAEAEAAKARKEAEVLRLLAADGVPAAAVTDLSEADQIKLSLMGGLTTKPGDMEAVETPEDATEEARGGRTVTVTTLEQANALSAKLKAIGVRVGDPTPSFDNIAASRRDARLAALRDARAGAERYAAELGMKVGGVRRVSETGDNAVLPGLQEKIGALMATGGPGLMQTMMQPQKASVRVEESVVVEFALER